MARQGDSSVKLRDVAKAAGVSQGTASNVFSKPQLVRQEVREHVLGVAKELGYAGPSVTGRLLRQGKVNAVGVAAIEPLSYFFEDPWARQLMAEISDICDARGAGVALVSARSDERLDWNIQSALVDGFILLCVEGGERLVEITRQRQLPFVALAIGAAADQDIPAIGVDNITGARLAAEHIIGLGHRRLAILSAMLSDGNAGRVSEEYVHSATYSTSRDRARGYWQAMEAADIDRASAPIFETREDEASTHAVMAEMFAGPEPTAILAMSDKIAMYAVDWLFRHGRTVPGDVSVIGFDGVPESAVSTPKLTTMEQPMGEIARRAVEATLGGKQIEGKQVLQARLVVRETTAPPRMK